jgi:hypothetical protein
MFLLIAGLWGLFMQNSAICDNSVADEIVSLNVTNRPLGEVLDNLSIAADCQFSFDESWEEYPLSASFNNQPLHRGLKLLFRNINNAVIYGADRTVKIIIYDEAELSGNPIKPSATNRSYQQPTWQIQPNNEATAPQPEPGDPEYSSDADNLDQLPEENDESASESNEADAEITDTTKEESDETTAEENTDDLETEQADVAPEQESNQVEKTESTLGQSENSENTENAEESNQN